MEEIKKIRTQTFGGIEKTPDNKFNWWCEYHIDGHKETISLKSSEPYLDRNLAVEDLKKCAIKIKENMNKAFGSENIIMESDKIEIE